MNIFLKIKFGLKKPLYRAIELLLKFGNHGKAGKNILIVKIDRLGDFLLFSPAFALIKKAYPEHKITALVSPAGKAILDNLRFAGNIIVFDRKKFENNFLYRYKLLKGIGNAGFEKAIYPAYSREPIGDYLIKMSGAKERIGSGGDVSNISLNIKKKTDKWYTKLISQTGEAIHEIERNKEFLEGLGVKAGEYEIRLNIPEEDEKFAEEVLRSAENGKIIAIAPGAGDEKRKWSAENFIGLARKMLEYRDGGLIVILGGKEDVALGEKIKKTLGEKALNMTGKTSYPRLFALLKRADIFVGNDSGITHLASAAKTPTVEISCHPEGGIENHPNSPLRFGPYGVPNAILQPEPDEMCKDFCGERTARFINKITVDEAFEATKKLLR